MTSRRFFEQTATTLASLNNDELKKRIKSFSGRFKLDFTDAYLSKLTDDRLRHILLAAMITTKNQNQAKAS